MSLTDLFKKLNAPLRNPRWSWGSVRESDGTVILRVWQDEETKHKDHHFMMVLNPEAFVGKEKDQGYTERKKHIEQIRNGSRCLMVMCRVHDPDETPRKIKSFNRDDIFVGGEVLELEGKTWIERAGRIPVKDAIA